MNPFYDAPPGTIAFFVDTDGERFFVEVTKILYYTNDLGTHELGLGPLRRANLPEGFALSVPTEVIAGLANHVLYYFGSIPEQRYAVAFSLYWHEPAPGRTRAVIVPGAGELPAKWVAELTAQLQKMYGHALHMDKANSDEPSAEWQPRSEADRWLIEQFFDVYHEQHKPATFVEEWLCMRRDVDGDTREFPNAADNVRQIIAKERKRRRAKS